MTRRIVLAVLGLIVVLLATVALPLGLVTAAQDRRDFTDQAKSAATTLANVAEERLGDRASGHALRHLIASLGLDGDLVRVLDPAGSRVDGTRQAPQVTAAQRGRGYTATQPVAYQLDDYVLVVAPIRNDNGNANLGVVALARPTSPVHPRTALLWVLIGGVWAAGRLPAALVAIGLARWVRKP